jgi:hypothetical protein
MPLDMNGFAAYNPVAGVQLAAYAAVGLRESLLSMAAISVFPPGSLYRSPALATVTLTLALTRTPALILALASPTPSSPSLTPSASLTKYRPPSVTLSTCSLSVAAVLMRF